MTGEQDVKPSGPPSPFHIETRSGLYVVPWDVDPALVRIEDIAFALSNIGRFTGHVRTTVAAHSVVVARMMEGLGACACGQYLGLMHDAREAYLGDLNKPTCRQPDMTPFAAAKERAQAAIMKALPGPGSCVDCGQCRAVEELHALDAVSCLIEAGHGLPSRGRGWSIATPANLELERVVLETMNCVGKRFVNGTMSRAESEMWFMDKYESLCEAERIQGD
jgi:hypothetical protein